MKKILLKALKASTSTVFFALSITGLNLNAADVATTALAPVPQQEVQISASMQTPAASYMISEAPRIQSTETPALIRAMPTLAHPAQALPPIDEQETSLTQTVVITDSDDVSPLNIMEKLHAIKSMPFSRDRRIAIFKIVKTSNNDFGSYAAEAKGLFEDILRAEVKSTAQAGSQLSEIIKELYKNKNHSLVSDATIKEIHHILDSADGHSRTARKKAHAASPIVRSKSHRESQDEAEKSSHTGRRNKHLKSSGKQHDEDQHNNDEAKSQGKKRKKHRKGKAVEHTAAKAEHEENSTHSHSKKDKKSKKNKSKKGHQQHGARHDEETKTTKHHEEKSGNKKKSKKDKKSKSRKDKKGKKHHKGHEREERN